MVFAKGESHEQDGETLSGAASAISTASGDPAMAFEPFVGSPGRFARGVRSSPQLWLPDFWKSRALLRSRDTRAGYVPRETLRA